MDGDVIDVSLHGEALRQAQIKVVEATTQCAAILKEAGVVGIVLVAVPGVGNTRLCLDAPFSFGSIGPNDSLITFTDPPAEGRDVAVAQMLNVMSMLADLSMNSAMSLGEVVGHIEKKYQVHAEVESYPLPPPEVH